MRTVVQISDLHFGRVDPALLQPLLTFIRQTNPNLVVICGDFTQRARPEQFAEARDFLSSISFPSLVVPGNHDVPLYNLYDRFFRPLDRYRTYISEDLNPFYSDDELAVAGINTARSFTSQYGRINQRQIERAAAHFATMPPGRTRIIVTHHPFDLPPGFAEQKQIVGRARHAMMAFSRANVDLLLAGHLHLTHVASTVARYALPGYAALVVQSGTAISTRGRGEPNSFNVLRIHPGKVHIDRIHWTPEAGEFRLAVTLDFVRKEEGWIAADAVE